MMKKYIVHFVLFALVFSTSKAENYVEKIYEIQTYSDLSYGIAIDFAGNERVLKLDISIPINDIKPECGRPLLVMIHGGAFIAGDKNEGYPKLIREDFARRGYTTASVNYRLGQFQTDKLINCNIAGMELEWNCLNMADSSEWYRAYLRTVQDVNGAVRFLINNFDEFGIDPNNVFIVGESAGAFIAMGVGFIDDQSEVLTSLSSSMPDVLPPNSINEAPCIQNPIYNLDSSIASMRLTRNDLGHFSGELNKPLLSEYKVRAVGDFYGAVFNNIFKSFSTTVPALYIFHQPNDLIVPFDNNQIFKGYSECASQLASCQSIINRPFIQGAAGIKQILDELKTMGDDAPKYLYDVNSNTANCALQILNPSLQGHAMDNYGLRTLNMAEFFAGFIVDCNLSDIHQAGVPGQIPMIAPNPAINYIEINIPPLERGSGGVSESVKVFDVLGNVVISLGDSRFRGNDMRDVGNDRQVIRIDVSSLAPGVYFVKIADKMQKFIKL